MWDGVRVNLQSPRWLIWFGKLTLRTVKKVLRNPPCFALNRPRLGRCKEKLPPGIG